jgi:STAM-binding protein
MAQVAPPSNLKAVHCPLDIIDKFLNLADLNTGIKIETCALLCGREESNRYLITHLLVPRQEGHQDHCFMTDEIEPLEQ